MCEFHKIYVINSTTGTDISSGVPRAGVPRGLSLIPFPTYYTVYARREFSTICLAEQQPLPYIKRAFSPPSIVLFQKCSHQNTCVCSSGWSGIDCSVSSPAWQSTFPTAPSPRGGGLTPPPAEDPGPTLSHTHVCKYIICIESHV
jgi:hypothetical protein